MIISADEPPMPDLSHLSEEERKVIEEVMNRQKQEEVQEKQVEVKCEQELDQIEAEIKQRVEKAMRVVGTQEDAVCQICQKVKFSDGVGRKCQYCTLRFCVRCGGRQQMKQKQVLACSLCQKKQELLAKTGKWFHGKEGGGMTPKTGMTPSSTFVDAKPLGSDTNANIVAQQNAGLQQGVSPQQLQSRLSTSGAAPQPTMSQPQQPSGMVQQPPHNSMQPQNTVMSQPQQPAGMMQQQQHTPMQPQNSMMQSQHHPQNGMIPQQQHTQNTSIMPQHSQNPTIMHPNQQQQNPMLQQQQNPQNHMMQQQRSQNTMGPLQQQQQNQMMQQPQQQQQPLQQQPQQQSTSLLGGASSMLNKLNNIIQNPTQTLAQTVQPRQQQMQGQQMNQQMGHQMNLQMGQQQHMNQQQPHMSQQQPHMNQQQQNMNQQQQQFGGQMGQQQLMGMRQGPQDARTRRQNSLKRQTTLQGDDQLRGAAPVMTMAPHQRGQQQGYGQQGVYPQQQQPYGPQQQMQQQGSYGQQQQQPYGPQQQKPYGPQQQQQGMQNQGRYGPQQQYSRSPQSEQSLLQQPHGAQVPYSANVPAPDYNAPQFNHQTPCNGQPQDPYINQPGHPMQSHSSVPVPRPDYDASSSEDRYNRQYGAYPPSNRPSVPTPDYIDDRYRNGESRSKRGQLRESRSVDYEDRQPREMLYDDRPYSPHVPPYNHHRVQPPTPRQPRHHTRRKKVNAHPSPPGHRYATSPGGTVSANGTKRREVGRFGNPLTDALYNKSMPNNTSGPRLATSDTELRNITDSPTIFSGRRMSGNNVTAASIQAKKRWTIRHLDAATSSEEEEIWSTTDPPSGDEWFRAAVHKGSHSADHVGHGSLPKVVWKVNEAGTHLIGAMSLSKRHNAMQLTQGGGLGLKLKGGRLKSEGTLGTFVEKVKRGSVADVIGQVREGDEVMQWNGHKLQNLTYDQVCNILNDTLNSKTIQMVVARDLTVVPKDAPADDDSTPKAHRAGMLHRPILVPAGAVQAESSLLTPIAGLQPAHLAFAQNSGGFGGFGRAMIPSISVGGPAGLGGMVHTATSIDNFASLGIAGQQNALTIQPTIQEASTIIQGFVQLGIYHDPVQYQLMLTVYQGHGLATRFDGSARCGYVKSFLLPDRSERSQRKSRVIMNSNNPVWDQTFLYPGLRKRDLSGRLLELTVWDYNRNAYNEFLGEILLDLAVTPFDNVPRWFQLTEVDDSFRKERLRSKQTSVYTSQEYLPQIEHLPEYSFSTGLPHPGPYIDPSFAAPWEMEGMPPTYQYNPMSQHLDVNTLRPFDHHRQQPSMPRSHTYHMHEPETVGQPGASGSWFYRRGQQDESGYMSDSLHENYGHHPPHLSRRGGRSKSGLDPRAKRYQSSFDLPRPYSPTEQQDKRAQYRYQTVRSDGADIPESHSYNRIAASSPSVAPQRPPHVRQDTRERLRLEDQEPMQPQTKQNRAAMGMAGYLSDEEGSSITSSVRTPDRNGPMQIHPVTATSMAGRVPQGPPQNDSFDMMDDGISETSGRQNQIQQPTAQQQRMSRKRQQEDEEMRRKSLMTRLIGKSSSADRNAQDAKKRLGFPRSEEVGVPPSMQNRQSSLENGLVGPPEMIQATPAISINNIQAYPVNTQAPVTAGPDAFGEFVQDLGPGQRVGRQVLASPCLGEVQVGMAVRRGVLEVEVVRARNLRVKSDSKIDPATFVKVELIDGKEVIAKAKTPIAQRTREPYYQQQLIFTEAFSGKLLQVSLWGDFGRMDRRVFMGIALINLDELDLSSTLMSWYKLYSSTSLVGTSNSPRRDE